MEGHTPSSTYSQWIDSYIVDGRVLTCQSLSLCCVPPGRATFTSPTCLLDFAFGRLGEGGKKYRSTLCNASTLAVYKRRYQGVLKLFCSGCNNTSWAWSWITRWTRKAVETNALTTCCLLIGSTQNKWCIRCGATGADTEPMSSPSTSARVLHTEKRRKEFPFSSNFDFSLQNHLIQLDTLAWFPWPPSGTTGPD